MSRQSSTGTGCGKSDWHQRYADRHRLSRIRDLPAGIQSPEKVRIYRRRDHHLLQWWDPREMKTLNERIDGDLVTTIARAREIDDCLRNVKSSGGKGRRIRHDELVTSFVADLRRRADAGEIDTATVSRYETALRHYSDFVGHPGVSRSYRFAVQIDRDFRLDFTAYLNQLRVSGNGHPASAHRAMVAQEYVLDVVRAMLQWAADPDRGKLLPESFRNPFARRGQRRQVAADPVGDPDITTSMAVDLILACDAFQLRAFAPLVLYGLRPGELGWLFYEWIKNDWVHVRCLPELDYLTKGHRDKRFPAVRCLEPLWYSSVGAGGLVYGSRRVAEGRKSLPAVGLHLRKLAAEYERRCQKHGANSASDRRRIRNSLMKDAGQLNYDHIEAEFGKLARRLNWPASATLKDLRHLFSTSLENAGVPVFFRRYFMGQSPGKSPIVSYTHLTLEKVTEQYNKALSSELAVIEQAIEKRAAQLYLLT